VKIHKFGAWGPSCSGPPPDWGTIPIDTKPSTMTDQLKIITDRLEKLEMSKGANGATQQSSQVSSDDEVEVDFESMTRKQMIAYIKNSNKDKAELTKAASGGASKNVRFNEVPRSRGLSISNLFDDKYLRSQDELNMQKAADKLKEKHRDRSKDDNRIPGVPTIDDLRRDPGLAGAADDFLRDAAGRAPWLRNPGDHVRAPPPPPQHGRDSGWDRSSYRDNHSDREWANRDAVLLNRNRVYSSSVCGLWTEVWRQVRRVLSLLVMECGPFAMFHTTTIGLSACPCVYGGYGSCK